jgi:hypothetical protein
MGEWECMDCGYKFKLSTFDTVSKKIDSGGRTPIRKLITVAVVLIASPWLLLLLSELFPYNVRGVFGAVSAFLFIMSGLYILLLIVYAILRIAFKK